MFTVSAQIEIGRQVIGSTGGFAPIGSQYDISFTVGEPVVNTVVAESLTLTQGFHQPVSAGPLRFDMDVINTTCPYLEDGWARVKNIKGCRAPYKIEWSVGNETSAINDLSPGTYSVTISTDKCSETVTFEIIDGPLDNCGVHFYNAFSPNNDLSNDVWVIDNITFEEYQPNRVRIFNRWGQEIWNGDNYDNVNTVWDGKNFKGEEMPDGTYYYMAEVAGKSYNGYIELIR